jgi:hypothetical protein
MDLCWENADTQNTQINEEQTKCYRKSRMIIGTDYYTTVAGTNDQKAHNFYTAS